jgi:glycosyltransferase involved in cell wall biosynthesis
MRKTIAFFLGTFEDWGGASRALLNFVRGIDRDRYRPLVILTRTGNLSAQLTEEGIDWLIWEKHARSKNLVAYAMHIASAYQMFMRQRIDLIHMNFGAIGWKPAEILAARLAGIPLINHLHITARNPSSYLRYSNAVVAVSNYVATHTNTFGVPTHAIHNVSYLARFAHGQDIRDELGYTDKNVLVVYMGQMIRPKGIEMLIEAFKQIPNEDARLLMAGGIRQTEGAYTEAEVQELVSRDPRIRYLGFRTDAENLYRTADIMTMPSQWEEPCAMILFEAAAAGRPLIATATGGTPEILRHGETGFLVDRSDVQELTRYMRLLIDDPALRQKLGEQAALVAQQEYAQGPLKEMEQLYDSLL